MIAVIRAALNYKQNYMIGDKKLRGFTLIEILVAVSIFAVIILVTSSIFRNVLVNQKTAADDSETREDVKYFLEIFSREAKDAVRNTSTAPVCGVEPDHMFGGNASSTELYFQNVSGNCVAYFTELDNDINRLKIQRDGADFFVSSAKINVSALSFITDDAADVQPIVTMNIQVLSQVDQTIPAYNIQTTISPREMMAPAAPPAPVIFSPSSVSGLNLWLKADAGVTTTTGDAVTTWSDQSGNGNNATQASGAYQPILNPGVLNGYNAVTFNNKTMNLASNIQLTSDFTYFQVFKKAVASTVWAGMGLANSGNDRSSFYQWDDGNIYIQNST